MRRIQNVSVQLSILLGLSAATVAGADCVDPNTCFGTGALHQHTSGDDNSAFGFHALGADIEGQLQTAIGARALSNGVLPPFQAVSCSGPGLPCGNTAVGAYSLNSITSGSLNTGVGPGTLARTTTGWENTALGWAAMQSNTTGGANIAIGINALYSNTTGNSNIAIGGLALQNSLTSWNIAVGTEALLYSNGQNNIGIGTEAMLNAVTGNFNVAVGDRALAGDEFTDSSGSYNVAIGAGAFKRNANGNYNTATGYQSMGSLGNPETTSPNLGSDNTAYGARSLRSNQSGGSNTALGSNALYSNTDGNYNTAIGKYAFRYATTGARNVAIGYRAGQAIISGSDNIIIGGDNAGVANDLGVIRIGRSANQKKAFIAGIRGVQTGLATAAAVFVDANGQLGTIKSSREVKENILPMGDVSERLLSLRPVTFQYKQADDGGGKPIQFGLIAEEVAKSFPELVVYDANGKPETVAYHLLATLLLNEFQKERGVTQTQATRIAELEEEFARLSETVERLAHASVVARTR